MTTKYRPCQKCGGDDINSHGVVFMSVRMTGADHAHKQSCGDFVDFYLCTECFNKFMNAYNIEGAKDNA